MAVIRWGLDYYTGLPEVDRQHEELFVLINRLHDATNDRGTIVDQAFEDLRDYVREHFAIEEKLMAEAGVDPGHYAEHRDAHAGFVACIDRLWARHRAGEEEAAAELLQFLTNWLVQHIMRTDRRMALEIHTRMGTQAPHNMFAHF